MRSIVFLSCALAAGVAQASEGSPTELVRGFFSALDRGDFAGAIGRTVGSARDRTSDWVAELKRQSASKHVGLDVVTRKIEVADAGGGKVSAAFDLEIVARFLFVKRVVRRLTGEAHFLVDVPKRQITWIDGVLSR